MEYHNICMGCMGDKGQAELCPHCGYIEGTEPPGGQYLLPRTMLSGKYLIGKGLGHGGFGITYLAYDTVLKRKLAIKEYLPQDCATRAVGQSRVSPFSGEEKQEQFEYGVDKFLEEARTLAQFDGHPNIVGVRDFFKENGTAYLVMNFLSGETLKDYLRRHNRALGYQQALKIMLPVMDALRTVHAAGVLHRDVSPDNIFLTNGGQVKLIDFGAARQPRDGQRSISVILKPGYAPEEQYRSRGKQGPWTDVYATGATLYRAITGKVPAESLDRLDQDTLAPPSQLGVRIPPEAEAALLRAMAVRATDRYQSIQAFKDALALAEGAQQPTPAQRPAPSASAVQQRPQPRVDLPERRTQPQARSSSEHSQERRPSLPDRNRRSGGEEPNTYPLQYRRGKGLRIGLVIAILIVLIVVGSVLTLLYWVSGAMDNLGASSPSAAVITTTPTPSVTPDETSTANPGGVEATEDPSEEELSPEPSPIVTPIPAGMLEGAVSSRNSSDYVPGDKMLITSVNRGTTQVRLTGKVDGGVGSQTMLVCEGEMNDAKTQVQKVYVYYVNPEGDVCYAPLDEMESAKIHLPKSCAVGTMWTLGGARQQVVAVNYTATLGGITYRDCIVVKENQSGTDVYKFYVPGFGLHTVRPSLEEDAEGTFRVIKQEGTNMNLFHYVEAVG